MTATFQVQNVHCTSCANRIMKAIRAVHPGAEVRVDVESGRVTVDAGGDPATILAAIEGAGYPASAAGSQPS